MVGDNDEWQIAKNDKGRGNEIMCLRKRKNIYDNLIKTLSESTTFHMSLGSKELFHSNFLHWLSIVSYDGFLGVMRKFAELEENEKFWWEKDFSPEKGNLEVRREFHKCDLSIYLLDSEYEKKSRNKKYYDNEKQDVNKEGITKIQRWIPVLVLENKMKSLPYKEQLEEYTKKAFEEWKNGNNKINVKQEIDELKKKNKNEEELESKYPMTFILLALYNPISSNYSFSQDIKYGKKKEKTIHIKFEWKCKSYKDFIQELNGFKFKYNRRKLDKQMLKDYCNFVSAFIELSEDDWKIELENSFLNKIYPWENPDLVEEKNKIDHYRKLRIHDIREKILYNQLLCCLEEKMKEKKKLFKRFNKNSYLNFFYKDNIRIFTNVNYAHNIGILEVIYILEKNEPKKKKRELLSLIIQIQGSNYCHMVKKDNIVNRIDNQGSNQYEIKLNEPLKKKLNDFIATDNSKIKRFPKIFSQDEEPIFGKYKKYTNNLIYQSLKIPNKISNSKLIDSIIEDVEKISKITLS